MTMNGENPVVCFALLLFPADPTAYFHRQTLSGWLVSTDMEETGVK